MTVNHNATRAGKKFEADLMKYMREQGFDVERLRLTGKEDEGDLLVRRGGHWVIEAKRTKSLDLAGWVREAQVERGNYLAHRTNSLTGTSFGLKAGFVVVHYARGKGLGGSYVTTTLDEWLSRL